MAVCSIWRISSHRKLQSRRRSQQHLPSRRLKWERTTRIELISLLSPFSLRMKMQTHKLTR